MHNTSQNLGMRRKGGPFPPFSFLNYRRSPYALSATEYPSITTFQKITSVPHKPPIPLLVAEQHPSIIPFGFAAYFRCRMPPGNPSAVSIFPCHYEALCLYFSGINEALSEAQMLSSFSCSSGFLFLNLELRISFLD